AERRAYGPRTRDETRHRLRRALEGHAKIAAQGVAHIEQVLFDQRPIQPVFTQVVGLGLRREWHLVFVVRAARDGVHEQENDHAHDKEDDEDAGETAEKIASHWLHLESPISNLRDFEIGDWRLRDWLVGRLAVVAHIIGDVD